MDFLLGGGLIAVGLLLLRRAKRGPGEAAPGMERRTPAAVPTPAAPSAATPSAPTGGGLDVEGVGWQTFVSQLNEEKDPDRIEEMTQALVDYYRAKIAPGDGKSTDAQILRTLKVKLPPRTDVSPEGTVIGDNIVNPSKSVVWNQFTSLQSDIEAQENRLAEYRKLRGDIEKNRARLVKDGVYEARVIKVDEDIASCEKYLRELRDELKVVKVPYDREIAEEKAEERKRREAEAAARARHRDEETPRKEGPHDGNEHGQPRRLRFEMKLPESELPPLMGPIEGLG